MIMQYAKCQILGCNNPCTATAHLECDGKRELGKLCAEHNSSHNTKPMKINSKCLVPINKIKK
jgi:hypothetical protein